MMSEHRHGRPQGAQPRLVVIAVVAFVALVVSGPVAAQPHWSTPPAMRAELLEPRGVRYTISLPAGYSGEERVPLVVALHFGGRVTPYFGKGILTSLVEPALRRLGAIMVAPDCASRDWTTRRSEEDVLALLDHVVASYAVDPDRVVITGYSMGGAGAWHIAARHQDRFSAAIIMAAAPRSSDLKVRWSIPLTVIHSRADTVVSIRGAERAVKKLQKAGATVRFVVLDDVGHYDITSVFEPLRDAVPWLLEVWEASR